jgi:hypothetical protein
MLALEHHSRRSEFLAMQVTMKNVFDVAKFLLVLVLNKPEQYKWTALVSLVAVAAALSLSLECNVVADHSSTAGCCLFDLPVSNSRPCLSLLDQWEKERREV